MTGLRTLWRRLGGFTAVLLVFALMFAPVADAAACANERPAAASEQAHSVAAATSEAAVASNEHRSAAPDMGGDLALCQHGHCHHAAPYPSVLATETAVPATGLPSVDGRQSQHVRSHWASRLERPPRA